MADHASNDARVTDDSIESGIDLGTTNSLCVWVTGIDASAHPPATFRFGDHRLNQPITPSVVGVHIRTKELLVGLDAVENEADNPHETIRSIKRLMGRRFDDEQVALLRRRVSYRVHGDEAGMAAVTLAGRAYLPPQISAMILRRMKADAEAHFGKRITHVVVAVPAYFDDNQRNATREAAREAGFFVKRIVSEPVAASYAYGYGIVPGRTEKILLFDLGGGTFDVSVIRASHPLSHVLAHMGDMWLGGDDVDAALLEVKRSEISRRLGIDPTVDSAFMSRLAADIRRAKEVVCQSERTSEDLRLERPIEVKGTIGGATLHRVTGVSVTRAEVAAASSGLVERAMRLVRQALSAARVGVNDINQVLLVGGGSYLPGVDEGLRAIFPADRIAARQAPIAAVAIGCGILARLIVGVECQCGHVNARLAVRCASCGTALEPFIDRTHLPYGIGVKGGRFEEVLAKGTVCPTIAPVARTFYTTHPDQSKIYIPVYQGESRVAHLNQLQGFITVQLPEPKPLNTPVELQMSLSKDRLLEIEVSCHAYRVETSLRPGDWSTSLQTEIQRARINSLELTEVVEGERVLEEWQSTPRDSELERRVSVRGRELLERLKGIRWDWVIQVPLDFLRTLAGEEEPKRPYIDLVEGAARSGVRSALLQFKEFGEASGDGDRDSVERAIWDAIDGLFRDSIGRCLSLIVLFGHQGATNPDHGELARDRAELDAILSHYRDSSRQGVSAEAQEVLDRARARIVAIVNRPYYKRVENSWFERKDAYGLLSSTPQHGLEQQTRSMRG